MNRRLFRTILVAGFSVSAAYSVAAQQTQPTPQPKPAAVRKKQPVTKPAPKNSHKVWSNDDVASLRTPEDKYVEAKETSLPAQPTAPAAPAAKPTTSAAPTTPAKPAASSSTPIKLPETIEKTEQVIRENNQDIHDAEDSLRQLKAEWTVTPEAQKTQKQAEMKRTEKLIADTQADLKILQGHLQKLRASQPAQSTAAPQ